MDFRLYAQVLWRHKVVIVLGLCVAIALAELSVVRVSPAGTVRYRHAQLWASTTRLAVRSPQIGTLQPPPIDLGALASQYAIWATSDDVRSLILRDGPMRGQILANPLTTSSGAYQPFVDVTGISTSPPGALSLANRAANALQTYFHMQQRAGRVPPPDRVLLQQILRNPPVVYQPRSKTMPILIFLAVMFAFVGLAFLLENLQSRNPEAETTERKGHDPLESHAATQRRSA